MVGRRFPARGKMQQTIRSVGSAIGVLLGGAMTLGFPGLILAAVLEGCDQAAAKSSRLRLAFPAIIVALACAVGTLSAFLLAAYGRVLTSQGIIPWIIYRVVTAVSTVPIVIAFDESSKGLTHEGARAHALAKRIGIAVCVLVCVIALSNASVYAEGANAFWTGVSQLGALIGPVLPWVLRALVAYVAWTSAQSAFKSTLTPWKTLGRASFLTAALMALAAYGFGREREPDCD